MFELFHHIDEECLLVRFILNAQKCCWIAKNEAESLQIKNMSLKLLFRSQIRNFWED